MIVRGLRNQGSTCYMNCMLQSLFHLPLFRKFIYSIDNSNIKLPKKSISYQLQLLFAQLQKSDQFTVKTRDFASSLGLKACFFQKQHDIHEFTSVFFDALKVQINDPFFEELFEGISSVSVLGKDGNEIIYQKEEKFTNISMTVKDCSSLEKSFQLYVSKEEVLNYRDDNNVLHKSVLLKTNFIKLPKVLHIYLNRFSYIVKNRKIFSYFSFPKSIDMAPYLNSPNKHTGSTNYQLFGVVVHRGNSKQGHYYLFSKVTSKNNQFKMVQRVSENEKQEKSKQETSKQEISKIETNKHKTNKQKTNKQNTNKLEKCKQKNEEPENDNPENEKPENEKPENEHEGVWYKFSDSYVVKVSEFLAIDDNFGDDILNASENQKSELKNYCAYMLTYAQSSEISNLFCSVPGSMIPTYIKDELNIEDKGPKITFYLVTTNVMKLNIARNQPLTQDNENTLEIKIHLSSTFAHLLQKISVKLYSNILLNKNEIEIWAINSENGVFSSLDFREIKVVGEISSRKLFVDQKSGTEGTLVFILFYFRLQVSPIKYLFSYIIKNGEPLNVVFDKLSAVIGVGEESLTKMNCFEYINGNIFRLMNPLIYIPKISGICYIFESAEERINKILARRHSLVADSCSYPKSNTFHLIEYCPISPINSAEFFFLSFSKKINIGFADNFNYVPNFTIICPRAFKTNFLIYFFKKEFQKKDIILYSNIDHSPIKCSSFKNIGKLYDKLALNRKKYPFLFFNNGDDLERSPINVILSADSIHPTYYQRIFVGKNAKYSSILENIQKEQKKCLGKAIVRIIVIKNKAIIKICKIDDIIEIESDWIRFESIPKDQCFKINPKISKFCQCRYIHTGDKIKALPFFIFINKDESFKKVKQNLVEKDIIEKSSKLYLKIDQNSEMIKLTDGDIIFPKVVHESCILINL